MLEGATALAVPTKFGQDLSVEKIKEPQLIWGSFTNTGDCWFEAVFELPKLRLVNATFNSDSDGEIIPHLFEEFGSNFVNKIEGMFAIAIWEKVSRELHLFRDRFGKKPLLYKTFSDGSIHFASEIKSL